MQMLVNKSYVMAEEQLFIAKSQLCFSADEQRMIQLRDFLVEQLSKSKQPVAIQQLIHATQTPFCELLPILENIGTRLLTPNGLVNVVQYSLKMPKSAEQCALNMNDHLKTIRTDWNSLQ